MTSFNYISYLEVEFMKNVLGVALVLLLVFTSLSTSFAEQEKKDEPLKFSGYIDAVAGIYTGDARRNGGLDSYANLYLLGINLDGKIGKFGYHATVNFTGSGADSGSTSTRHFSSYTSPVWIEEGYIFADLGLGSDSKIKVGSVYNPFGLDGDNSWYFQLHYYAGMSVDADYGIVSDFNFALSKSIDFRLALGYYLQDDNQNGSRNAGYTDVSIEGDTNNFEERDKFVGRIAPTFNFGKHSVGIGASVMFGNVKVVNEQGSTRQYAYEADLDANLNFGKIAFRAFGEIIIADRNTRMSHGVNKKYTLWLAGGTLSYELGSKWLKSIDVHGNYGVLNRRNQSSGVGNTYDSNLFIIGSAIGWSDNFTTTIEYVVGKVDDSKGLTTTGNRFDEVLIIDFFYSF